MPMQMQSCLFCWLEVLFVCWLGVVNRSSIFLFRFPRCHPCIFILCVCVCWLFALFYRCIYRLVAFLSGLPAWNFAIGANHLSGIINVFLYLSNMGTLRWFWMKHRGNLGLRCWCSKWVFSVALFGA